jgi:hypothetical protein
MPPRIVRRIVDTLAPLRFDRVYSLSRCIAADAHDIVDRSLDRYVRWAGDDEATTMDT